MGEREREEGEILEEWSVETRFLDSGDGKDWWWWREERRWWIRWRVEICLVGWFSLVGACLFVGYLDFLFIYPFSTIYILKIFLWIKSIPYYVYCYLFNFY